MKNQNEMMTIDENEMLDVSGGDSVNYADAICGIAVGVTIAATISFGFVGFAVTWGKAVAACGYAATH